MTNDKYEGNNILIFQNGILGFEDVKRYKLEPSDDDSPFYSLTAVDGHPSFVVCDPLWFVPDYTIPNLPGIDNAIERLAADSAEDLRCLAIVNIPGTACDATANLKAPVIINIKNNYADQFVLDDPDLLIKYRLFDNSPAYENSRAEVE